MYNVFFTTSAFKEYRKLSKKVRSRVDEVIAVLRVNPTSEILKIKKIRGKENHYRVRIGDYRLIYTPLAERLIIRVIRVGHRKDVHEHF